MRGEGDGYNGDSRGQLQHSAFAKGMRFAENVLKREEREGVMLAREPDPGLCWFSDRRVSQRRRYDGETPWLMFRRKGVSDRRNPRHDTWRERRGA